MKIRLDRTMYTKAQRIADSKSETFNRWTFRAIASYRNTSDKPKAKLEPLTRENSVSAAVDVPLHTEVTPTRIRECIALAIEDQDQQDIGWPFRYDRSTLDALIQVERMLSHRTVCYSEAQDICDWRVAQRKEEIRVAEKGKRKK